MVPDYEKMGLLYLGRRQDPGTLAESPLLFKNNDLTTHAAIIGMTGSGKTGLGIGLIEEVAMDGVPCLVIDPKGDMGNLMLTFPDLSPASFAPWIDENEAARKGMDLPSYAAEVARTWKEGLASWGQDGGRIAALRRKAAFTLYTPGSRIGTPIALIGDFAPPGDAVLEDADLFSTLVASTVSGLLALIGDDDDPLTSRPHLLLSTIFTHAWRRGESLGLTGVIMQIIAPPFSTLGVFPLESFYGRKERTQLAMRFNALLASPTFEAWMEGEPLEPERLLYTPDGKPRVAIFNIAHLDDKARMFFVSLLLNRTLAWMRRQPGSSSLKTLLYMDEIYGFFPPSKNPPSKRPMMLLLKQARAYGLGVVLSTQNPVDLDYKGLSNIGTWFVGRLQTEQDQEKVADGIAGAGAAFNRQTVKRLLSSLKRRQFLLKSVHLEVPLLFRTRWVLSYLKGPMSSSDIKRLQPSLPDASPASEPAAHTPDTAGHTEPVLTSDLTVRYLHVAGAEAPQYGAVLIARTSVRFTDDRKGIDITNPFWTRCMPQAGEKAAKWDMPIEGAPDTTMFSTSPAPGAHYASIPAFLAAPKANATLEKAAADHFYRRCRLELLRVVSLKLTSEPLESAAAFMSRVADRLRAMRDRELETLQERYAARRQTLLVQLQNAEFALHKEQSDVEARTTDTIVSAGMAVLGAIFGGRSSGISKGAATVRKAGRIGKEKMDVQKARLRKEQLEEKLEALAQELSLKSREITDKWDIANHQPESFTIKPRRADIDPPEVMLVWDATRHVR